jgi:hypothetical protein
MMQSFLVVFFMIGFALTSNAFAQTNPSVPIGEKTMIDFSIDELANHNTPPELVKSKRFLRPNYPTAYDFDHDRRIRELFFKIVRSESDGVWETLIEHCDDSRYALVVSDNGTDAEIWTVGRICRYVTKSRMLILDRVHSDVNSVDRPDIQLRPTAEIGDIKSWWETNGKKPLHNVQLEQCKDNLSRLLAHPELPDATKEYYRKKISEEIELLTKSHKPIFQHLSWDRFDWFIPRPKLDAEKVRTK